MSKDEVFSGPYFLAFSPNTGKYGPEKTPYLDTFHAMYFNPNAIMYNHKTITRNNFYFTSHPFKINLVEKTKPPNFTFSMYV